MLAALLGALVFGAPGTAAADQVLTAQAGGGGVAAAGGVVAWSSYDTAARAYRLMVWRDGAATPLGVAPAPAPFDVSAGIGPDKAVWLVWSRCGTAGCDVVRWDMASPGERRIAVAALPGWDEVHPAIDRGRIAFGRTSSSGRAQVLVAGVSGVPAARVVPAALPAGVCADAPAQQSPCGPSALIQLDGVALHGNGLAVSSRASVSRTSIAPGLCGLASLRYVDLRTGIARRVTDTTCGLAGATIVSPSFDPAGRLWFARGCNSTQEACRGRVGSPQRYTPATGTTDATTSVLDGSVRGLAPAPEGLVVSRWGTTGVQACYVEQAYLCGTVSMIAVGPFSEPPTWSPRTPDRPLVAVRTLKRAQVLRPASPVPCLTANPHPRRGADIWGGAVAPVGRSWTMAALATGGRAVGRRFTAGYGWRFAHLSLTGSGVCGSTVTVTYRIAGDRPQAFRVRVEGPR